MLTTSAAQETTTMVHRLEKVTEVRSLVRPAVLAACSCGYVGEGRPAENTPSRWRLARWAALAHVEAHMDRAEQAGQRVDYDSIN